MARRRPKERERALYFCIPETLARRLDARLKKSRRTLKAELILAVEAWLARQEENDNKGGQWTQ
jgi:hypothetical protein